ncbi:MAG: hypothetical protein JWQ27_2811 [Ferruginibacter sp.]|nr:hypothetical protein [Ferruginibacter sp.]
MPVRPRLTALMITHLKECKHKSEQNIPCTPNDFPRTLKGLLSRDLLAIERDLVKNHWETRVVFTQKGVELLRSLEYRENIT